MSSVVSSIFGGSGNAPGQVQSPLTQGQINEQYGNVQNGLTQQDQFLQAINAQNGLGNQANVYNQLQQVANGHGPNPAMAQLANATGANTANQAALMAGQRGASANPALIARQAAMQGAANQQQAVGQGAALQAQQSQNALNSMGQLATTQVGQQQNALQGYQSGAQNALNTATGAVQNANNTNSAAQIAQANMQAQVIGNIAGAAGSAMQLPTKKAEGGMIEAPKAGPRSMAAQHLARFAQGGAVPALVSPGEQYLPPQAAQAVAQGQARPFAVGERIPGQPMVKGNSYANDTVPKTLEAGGVVIPNSIMQSSDAEAKAAEFVRKVLARNNQKK